MDLSPKPGFDWTRVAWVAPWDYVSDGCSYCGASIDEDDRDYVPLWLWNAEGWAAVFCDACMHTWWGFDLLDHDE